MIVFFVFKQKTAYEMRISDWSSDVCSSDLIKLDSDRPVARIEAIRKCRPDTRLTVDANQGWSFEQLKEIAAAMQKLGVLFIEQPLPRGSDRSEEHTSELQSLMRTSYAVFCLKKKKITKPDTTEHTQI